jgi:hypothetical protein
MDLRTLANSVSNTVNANMIVSVKASTGYTIGAGLKQVPAYAAPVDGPAQLQALDGYELKQLDNLNLQGVLRAIYLRGALAGIIRPNSKGGDLVTIAAPAPVQFRGIWLVVKVFETWSTWTKCAICLQEPA